MTVKKSLRVNRRRMLVERFEDRRLLALTSPDYVEIVSSGDDYQDNTRVWQRKLVAPSIVQDATTGGAYDLRVDVPGDQTLRLARDDSTSAGAQRVRDGELVTRVLVNPQAVYQLDYYGYYESSTFKIEAFDAAGNALGTFGLNVVDDPMVQYGGWHRGFIGNPHDRASSFVQLPDQTYSIEVRAGVAVELGFVGDAWDSGPQVVRWGDELSAVSDRRVDFIEADQPILVQPGRLYWLNASVRDKTTDPTTTFTVGYTAYDADGLRIEPKHVERYGSAADTRLASALKPGDTTIELVDASGWSNLAGPETRALAWYGYVGNSGQLYPDYSYTRNVASDSLQGLWDVGAVVGNRITLRSPWSGPTIGAGTAVRNVVDDPSTVFGVIAMDQTQFDNAQALVSGFRQNGFPDSASFPAGTASFRPAAVLNQTLQLSGYSVLSYLVSTQPTDAVDSDLVHHTRSVAIDVLANDALASQPGTQLVSVSNPKYGSVQILASTATTRAQVRYTSSPYLVGTDRFSYTVRQSNGQLVTEWVNVDNLGGNLDANPLLQFAVKQNNFPIHEPLEDFGGASFAVASGEVLTSRSDNLVNLTQMLKVSGRSVAYSLVRGVRHGSLSMQADGTFTYQSDPGFVGLETFEYTASNGVRTSTRVGTIQVDATAEEDDVRRARTIAQGLINSNQSKLFYGTNPLEFDANGAPLVSWRVRILPYIGYAQLYSQFRLTEPWDSPNNIALIDKMPDLFRSSDDSLPNYLTRFQTIKAGSVASPTEHLLNSNDSPHVRLSEIAHGRSNTLLVVQAGTDRAVPWTKPDDLAYDNLNPLATLGRFTGQWLAVAFADASAALMPNDVSSTSFTSLATVRETAGVTSIDGKTLMRDWSARRYDAATHSLSYMQSKPEALRQLNLAVQDYVSTIRKLPAWASTDTSGNPLLSWRVQLLPYMGHTELYNRFRLNEPWNSPYNLTLLDSMPDIFRAASDAANTNTTRLRVLKGPGTIYDVVTKILRPADITDGTGWTFFAVEAGVDKAVPWTMPETLPIGADFLSSLGQLDASYVYAITVDGVVKLPITTPNVTLQAMATYKGGEYVAWPTTQSGVNVRNSLAWVGISFRDYVSQTRRLPMNLWGDAFVKKTATPTLSWRVAILPNLGYLNLYNAFHFDEPWDSPHNLALLPYMPTEYLSNGGSLNSGETRMQMFTGSRTLLKPDGTTLRSVDMTDGAYGTVAIVEAGSDKAVPWTKPSDLDGEAIDLWQALGLVGQTVEVAYAEGNVFEISKRDMPYLNAEVLRNDGGNVPALDPRQRIVLREGGFAAIDLPTDQFTVENNGLIQWASAAFNPGNTYIPKATRLTIYANDDNQTNGTRTTSLTYNGRVVEIVVLDDESLKLTFESSTISEAHGRAILKVTRPPVNLETPLLLQLSVTQGSRLDLRDSIVMPAGFTSIEFDAFAIDNLIAGDSELLRVTVAAAGMGSSSAMLRIVDDESLTLSFSAASISEVGGVSTGTLVRQGDLSQPLVVQLTHDRPTKIRLPDQVIIPAGQSTLTFQATAIDNNLYDGTVVVHVIASAVGYGSIVGQLSVTDFEAVGLALSRSRVSEANETVTVTVTRLADSQGEPVTIALRTDRPDKLQVPSSVVVPGNASSVSVSLKTIDNVLLDGLATVHLTALADPVGDSNVVGDTVLEVTDQEAMSITISSASLSEKGGHATVRVTRSNSDIDLPITVDLVNSHPNLVRVPASVTIPASSQFVEFEIDALDNEELAVDTPVQLEARHAAYAAATIGFVVTDYEPLVLTFATAVGAEGTTLTGQVSRNNTNLSQPVTVRLRSDNVAEAEVPEVVTIPVGASSANFAVKLLRDRRIDGTQLVKIVAEAIGFIPAIAEITVTDAEFLSVLLVDQQTVREGDGIVMVRVSRSDLMDEFPITFAVSSSANQVAHGSGNNYRIEAGQVSIEIPISIGDDHVFTGPKNARLTFDVLDADLPDAHLDLIVEDDERPWHNAQNPLDVNNSGTVTALDALLIINALNRYGGRPIAEVPPEDDGQPWYIDTNDDQYLSALDALLVINYLNSQPAGEGEQGSETAAADAPAYPEIESLLAEEWRTKKMLRRSESK